MSNLIIPIKSVASLVSHTEFNAVVARLVAITNVNVLTDGVTIPVDASLGKHHQVTIAASRIMSNAINGFDGQIIRFAITQGAASVPGTPLRITWDTNYIDGAQYPISSIGFSDTAGATDYVDFMFKESTGKWLYMGSAMGY